MYSEMHQNLRKEGIFHHGSEELKIFENRLIRYFTREYSRYKSGNNLSININTGPLALDSKELAEKHYDEVLEFFQSILDSETMAYSMAYFDDNPENILSGSKTLSQAQIDKFRLISQRMGLQGSENILNIGCGFGYFESYLLNTYPNIRISSITHSKIQYDFVMNRQKNANDIISSERFNLFFGQIDDNSSTLLGNNKYDVVCTIGVLEHINNIELLFKIIENLLTDTGIMFHHLITSRDLIPQLLDSEKTLIGKYFPGGKVLPFSALHRNFDGFYLENSWFINGINYWKTLDMWHANFWNNLHKLYPDRIDVEKVRYWNNYFVLCKAMFFPENGIAYGNGQFLYKK